MRYIPEDAIFADLSAQLEREGVGDNPWVCWPLPNGDMKHATMGFGMTTKPDADRAMWAFERVRKVNDEAWLDGMWIGVWGDWGLAESAANLLVSVPRRFVLCFKDADGAMPITITCDEPWHKLCQLTVDKLVEDAAEAVRQTRERIAAIDVKPEQMDRPVIGQAAKENHR